jgi:hypothetical protein
MKKRMMRYDFRGRENESNFYYTDIIECERKKIEKEEI